MRRHAHQGVTAFIGERTESESERNMSIICPFCNLSSERKIVISEFCVAFPDRYPVSRGHTLIVPRRHIGSLFDLTPEERHDLFELMAQCKKLLDTDFSPDGFNIGLNDGSAAGQTVMHVHLHLIPRYKGDVEDPRGGVRWILPERAIYWDTDNQAD